MIGARLLASVLLVLPLVQTGCRAPVETKAPLFKRTISTAEAPAETLSLSVRYTFAADGTYTRVERHRYRLLTESGVRAWGTISQVWEPWYQEKPTLAATVKTPDGTEVALDPATISAGPAHEWSPQVFSDAQVIRAPLPAVTVGAEVEEVITVRSAKPLPWPQVHRETLQGPVKRGEVEVVIDAPERMPIRYLVDGVAEKAVEEVSGGRRRVTWRARDLAALKLPEDELPGDIHYWPRLVFAAHDRSWRDVARTYAGFVDDSLKGFEVPAPARAIVDARASREQKIHGLLEWVHDRVRYTGLELGTGTVLPASPATVLNRGYGDCKDQATMLVGLLRAAGIDAHVALLRAGFGADVTSDFPGVSEFNHAIVHIPGKEPLWIDPTSEYSRAGELPSSDRGRLALIAASDSQELVRTPLAGADDNTYVETRTVTLAELGKASVLEEITATGEQELGLRGSLSGSQKQLADGLSGYAKKEYEGAEVESFDLTPAADVASPYRFVLRVKKAGIGETKLANAAVDLGWGPLFHSLPRGLFAAGDDPEEKERRSPLAVPTPHDARLNYRIKVPAGFEPILPTFDPVDLGPVLLERSATREGDDVLVSLHVRLDAHRLTAEQVNTFRKRLEALEKQPGMRVVAVHRASLAYDRKDLAAAMKIVADEAKQGRATGRLRHADMLNTVHLREQALAELRGVIAADPTVSIAHVLLGDILHSDRFGRLHGKGWDRTGAVAAYLEAARLDEDLQVVKIHAAVDAETGDLGSPFGVGSDIARAAEIWESVDPEVVAGFHDNEFGNHALVGLWHLGRHDAIERLMTARGTSAPPVGKLMVAWKRGGIPGVLEEIRTGPSFPTLADRTRGMAGILGLLLTRETYANISTLADTAASLGMSEDPTVSMLRLTSRAAAQAKSVEAAATGPKKIFVDILDTTTLPTPEALEKATAALLSARVVKHKFVLDALAAWQRHARSGPMPATARVTRDTIVGAATLASEGSDATGHRVSVTLSMGTSTDAPVHLYVVREGGGYRLRATSSSRSELAREALHLLQTGDQKAARQWLAWYFEGKRKTDEHVLTQTPDVVMWTDGKPDLALVAHVILALYGDHDAYKAVVAARAKMKDTDPTAPILDHVIAGDAQSKADAAPAKRALAALRARFPDAEAIADLELMAAIATDDWAQLDRLVPAYLARHPKTFHVQRRWADTFVERGDVRRGIELLTELQAQGAATEGDFNNLAWWSLFTGVEPGERELQWALRAAGSDSAASVHTLGCVYAAMGRTLPALETFDRLTGLRAEPDLDDEFLLAEIHRQIGFVAEAREVYTRLAREEPDDRTSTAELARRRLAKKAR